MFFADVHSNRQYIVCIWQNIAYTLAVLCINITLYMDVFYFYLRYSVSFQENNTTLCSRERALVYVCETEIERARGEGEL